MQCKREENIGKYTYTILSVKEAFIVWVYSLRQERMQYEIRASQINTNLIKFIVNNISICL